MFGLSVIPSSSFPSLTIACCGVSFACMFPARLPQSLSLVLCKSKYFFLCVRMQPTACFVSVFGFSISMISSYVVGIYEYTFSFFL